MRLAKAFAAGRKNQGNHRQHCYLYVHLTLLGIDKLLIQETDSVADIPTDIPTDQITSLQINSCLDIPRRRISLTRTRTRLSFCLQSALPMNHPTGMSSVDGHGGGGLGIGIGNGNPSQQQQLQQQQYHHQGQPQGQQQYVPQPPQQYLQQPQQPQQYVPTQPQPQPTTSMSPQRQPQRNGPRANCDQVVFEAIAKAAEIVVASRCWIESDPALAAAQTGSGRFNLLVPEVKSVR